MHTDTFATEQKLPLSALHKLHPDLTSVSLKAMTRWAERGTRGHKLESVRIGGRLMSSREALQRFLDALNGGGPPTAGVANTSPPPRSPHQRSRASASAAAELDAAGC